jgi:hypothetical protein
MKRSSSSYNHSCMALLAFTRTLWGLVFWKRTFGQPSRSIWRHFAKTPWPALGIILHICRGY